MDGLILMPKLFAINWDTLVQVLTPYAQQKSHITLLKKSPQGASGRCCATFGRGSGSIYLTYVSCTGSEFSLFDCTYSNDTSRYSHYHDSGVQCQPGNQIYLTSLLLHKSHIFFSIVSGWGSETNRGKDRVGGKTGSVSRSEVGDCE